MTKYLNTPTTALYRRSDELLEQHTALQTGATPALAEGAFDVLAMTAPTVGDPLVPGTFGFHDGAS